MTTIDPAAGQAALVLPAGGQNNGSRMGNVRHAGWLLELERALFASGRQAGNHDSAPRPAPASVPPAIEKSSRPDDKTADATVATTPVGVATAVQVPAIAFASVVAGGSAGLMREAHAVASNARGSAALLPAAHDMAGSRNELSAGTLPGMSLSLHGMQPDAHIAKPPADKAMLSVLPMTAASLLAGRALLAYAGMPTRPLPADVPRAVHASALPGSNSIASLPATEASMSSRNRDNAAHSAGDTPLCQDGKPHLFSGPPAQGEAYARSHLHLLPGEHGMQAWIRDASLSAMQAAAVAEALRSELKEEGVQLSMVAINGKTIALRTRDAFAGEAGTVTWTNEKE